MDTAKQIATALFSSKKVLTAIAGVITLIVIRFTPFDEATVGPLSLQITGVVAALLIGQGATDLGKAAKAAETEGAKVGVEALQALLTAREE